MTKERTDLGPCAICRLDVEDGAAFSPSGEVIHPDGSSCYEYAWGPSPLTEGNARTARMIGRLVAMWEAKTGGPRKHVEVMLWLRNVTPDVAAPADGVAFSVDHDVVVVALIPDYASAGIVGVEELEDGRWLPLDVAAGRIDEWSNLLPLPASRALLASFLSIVRDTAEKARTS